jgi:hypothetical protein
MQARRDADNKRPESIDHADKSSFWTSLHQAAFLCAPIEVLEKMVSDGAFSNLPFPLALPFAFH